MPNLPKGKYGEDLAYTYLLKKGYQPIARNFRWKFGEIDLIVQKGNSLVFIEVKTRLSAQFGRPEEAVTARKLALITKTAYYFKSLHPKLPNDMQIDVIAIQFKDGQPVIEHLENVTG